MNIKSILLGAAAAAAAATGAQAADLPAAPEPVDYVRVCDAYGSGFFYLPGTETCVRLAGRIRSEFRVFNFSEDNLGGADGFQSRDQNGTRFRNRGYVRVDTRSQTEYGLLRTYASLHIQDQTASGTTPTLEFGFIQFGGLTAGKALSNFENFTGYTFAIPQAWGGSDIFTINQIAYTQAFGNGFSATLAIEDGVQTRGTIITSTGANTYNTTDQYGGHRLPDLIANFRVDQGWGNLFLAGKLHQVLNNDLTHDGGVDSETGWGVLAGVYVNLPFIAAGDQLAFQVGYGEGVTGSITSGVGAFGTDGVIDASGDIELTEAFSIGGGFTHNWTPHWSTNFNANYTDIDASEGDLYDLESTSVQGNLVWSPARGFLIGAELNYTYREFGDDALDNTDNLTGAIRVQRTF